MNSRQKSDFSSKKTKIDNFSVSSKNKRPLFIIESSPEYNPCGINSEMIEAVQLVSSTPLRKKCKEDSKGLEISGDPFLSKPQLENWKENNSCDKDSGLNTRVNENIGQHGRPTSYITGQRFKDIVYCCLYNDFCKPYTKFFNFKSIQSCYDPEAVIRSHENIQCKEITTFSNGTFFSILDNALSNWFYDICTAASSILRPQVFFSGDVLRILFDYVLNGPKEEIVWGLKDVLDCHFELHPPCSESMRKFYLTLLKDPYKKESYFKTDLTKYGILNHIINQLEEGHELTNPFTQEVKEEDSEEVDGNTKNSLQPDEGQMQEITFEMMEQRWNNFEPLLDTEFNEVNDALDDLEKSNQESEELDTMKSKTMPRLAIALEIVVDILEADFLICIFKLKRYISSENGEFVTPLIKHFMDENLHIRAFVLYGRTTDQALWIQLSRLIAVMAEFEHLFNPSPLKYWKYPNLNIHCDRFATSFCNTLDEYVSDWSEEERLTRLKMLSPPWLRLKVAMHWVNSDLKIGVGSDLKALVDTIHMHIISPMKFEKDVHFKVNNIAVKEQSPEFIKKATKKNKYGETMLHRTSKDKKCSKSTLFILLSLSEVDVNAKDNYGWTPLHEAVLSGSVFKTKTLLQYQPPPGRLPVEVGAQNSVGSTPLHEAVIAGNLELCKLLVDYGGACLLRKTDCEGVTPLELAKQKAEIKRFFDRVIKTQEMLNLSADSVLSMPEFVLQLLVVACDAFLEDHHTWQVYCDTKFNPEPKTLEPHSWIVIDQDTLLALKKDQDEFRKLRKILNKLAENPKNSSLIKAWDLKYQRCG